MEEDFEIVFNKVKPIVWKLSRYYFIKMWTREDWQQEGMLILHQLLREHPELEEDDTKLYEFDLFNNLNLDLVLNCEITDENFKNTKKEETKKNDNLENDEIKKDDNQDNIKNDDITQIINISKNEKNSEKELDKSTRNENKNEKYEMPNTSSNVNIVLIMFLNIIIGFIFIIHKNET